MSTLPAISAATVALIVWVMTRNVQATLFIWALESMLCIQRDVKYGHLSPVTWSDGWLPPGDGKASIAQLVTAKVSGFVVGVLAPIAGGSPLVALILVVANAIKSRSVLWILVLAAVNFLYQLGEDSLLLNACIIAALSWPRTAAEAKNRPAPNTVAGVGAILIGMLIGNAPGVNSACIATLIEGCPLWALGFTEAYIEGATLGKLFAGIPSAKGFIGAIETEMTLGWCLLAIAGGFSLGMVLMKQAEDITERVKNYWFISELQFWLCILLLDCPHKPLVVGGLMAIRSISPRLECLSGLLIPVIL